VILTLNPISVSPDGNPSSLQFSQVNPLPSPVDEETAELFQIDRICLCRGARHLPEISTKETSFVNVKEESRHKPGSSEGFQTLHCTPAQPWLTGSGTSCFVALTAVPSTLHMRLQEASGTFGYLRDVASVKVEAPRPVDVAPECAGMLAHLMLAQVRLRAVREGAASDRTADAMRMLQPRTLHAERDDMRKQYM